MSLIAAQPPFLELLRPADRAALVDLGVPRTYQPAEQLTREQDLSTFVVMIMDGWSTASVETEKGTRLILALHGPGEVVGDIAALDGGPRSATLTAIGVLHGRVIAGDRFRTFLARRPFVSSLVIRQLAIRLRSSDAERRSLVSESVLQRTAARLVELAERTGRVTEHGVTIDLPLPQHDLAASVGSTREAVAKALRLLREQDLVLTAPRRFVIAQLDVLRLLANGELPAALPAAPR
jgi:CRP/FNR family transcriptional regulator, cyclic AMP receptor protein